jgi:hypothetical protein
MAQWIAEGRMRPMDDVLEGLEQMPRALIRLYEGQNLGKQIVRVKKGNVPYFTSLRICVPSSRPTNTRARISEKAVW